MSNTILPILKNSEGPESIEVKLIKDGVFGGNITDREHLIATFDKNTADVQAMFGTDLPPSSLQLCAESLGLNLWR